MSVVLTKSRFSNALRCYASYALNRLGSALFRTPYTLHRTPYTVHHTPLFVSVEPSAVCQLRCPACPVGLRNNGITELRHSDRLLKKELWERVLSQIKDSAWVVQFYFQGEPLLNKDLPLMIREAHDAGLYTIVSTNAQAMTPELANALVAAGLDRIIISMDGLTQETYEAYRVGGSLDQCKAALRWLQEAKSAGLTIELQVLRLRSNEHEWRAFKKEYKALGADRLVFKTAQLYDYRHGHPLMPSEPRYRRYEQHADGLWYRKPLSKGCFRVWSGVVIAANGDVLPCCYDKDHAHAYGNLRTPEICKECWK